jgi:hypothetical protein
LKHFEPFDRAQGKLRNARIRRFLKTGRSSIPLPATHGIYLLGSGAWRVVDVVPVEEDLEVPVVHPVAARVWYV